MISALKSTGNVLVFRTKQRYLAKNPNGLCGMGGRGVPFKLAELQVGENA